MDSDEQQAKASPDGRYVEFSTTPKPIDGDAGLDCLIDVFCTADGVRRFVVLTHAGEPVLLDEDSALTSARIKQQLAVHDMVTDVAPRRLDVAGLYLFLPVTAERAVDLRGPNDPTYLRGCLSGPWLTEAQPVAGKARVMVMRADLLTAMAAGFTDQFVTPSDSAGGARSWSNLWLPVADEATIADGRGCLIAYPHNPMSSFLETGNQRATCSLAEQLLGEFRDDLQTDAQPGRLKDAKLPVACLTAHKEQLAANGIEVRDDKQVLAVPANAGWLQRAYRAISPKLEELPQQGDVAVFSSFAAMATHDLGDWPSPRSQALFTRLQRFQALWTPQIASSLRPVRYKRDGQFTISGGVIHTAAGINPNTRRLYFGVDDAFAATIGDQVELEFEYLDTDGAPITISYNATTDAYKKGGVIPRQGSGQWLTQAITLQDVAFQNAQNSGADFRFEFAHSDGAIRRILLKARPGQADG